MGGEECLTYLCSPFALPGFSEELLAELERDLGRLGYRRGLLDAWVMYPKPPSSEPQNPFADARQLRDRERRWVDDGKL